MRFFAYHGVYAEETKMGRYFVVDVDLDCAIELNDRDELGDTYNYEWIYQITAMEMKTPRKLLETLLYRISRALLAKSTLVQGGTIRIKKEALLIGGDVDRSVVEYSFKK